MTTLDSYNLSNVDVIKIDVEGSELHVLEGAPTLIDTQQPLIQVELRDTHCKRFGYTPDDIIQYVMGKGDYVMSDFNGNNLGEKYEKVKGVMDRFFIPQQIFSTLNIKKTVHPGMKLNTASTFQNLFEEKC
jgi:hypothetical protein